MKLGFEIESKNILGLIGKVEKIKKILLQAHEKAVSYKLFSLKKNDNDEYEMKISEKKKLGKGLVNLFGKAQGTNRGVSLVKNFSLKRKGINETT